METTRPGLEVIMGFDLYGRNPQLVGEKPEIDWDERPSEEERKSFFEQMEKFEEDNPGYYFRNNVWWWRPLWSYVCDYIAPDILSDEDKKGGEYNDCHHITAIKANYIADKIAEAHADGSLDKFGVWYAESREQLEDDHWAKSYPFDVDNVVEFGKFCKASGGFEIG